jgi:Uma2 family endonuclease
MSTATKTLLTSEDLLAMPDDGVERWLINGELREGDADATRRSYRHSRAMTRVAHLLRAWVDTQSEPRGEVLTGDAGFEMNGDTSVSSGIDVAYISPELAAATPEETYLVKGAPVLAVEILSPSDVQEKIAEKIGAYLANGVALVWLLDPIFETVTIYRPDAEPEFVNKRETLNGEPHLPGFEAPVASLFR